MDFVDGAGNSATTFVEDVIESMVERGVLLNSIGRFRNTLKIRPPMPFPTANADLLVDTLAEVLASLEARK